MRTLFTLILLLAWSVSCAAAENIPPKGAKASELAGLYAVIGWDVSPMEVTWKNSLVDGVVIRVYWKDLNPERNQYDWSLLDRQFAGAARWRKRIHLIVAPGFYSPQWILQDPRIAKAAFDVPGGPHHKKTEAQELPLPWDEVYLANWFEFVGKLAERYGRHSQLGYVSVTGPNSHNGEMSLPREPADAKQWLALADGNPDTLAEKLSSAWKKAIDAFCTAFQGKRVTLAVISRSLPLRDAPQLEPRYVETLVEYGWRHDPETFGLQTNGLDGRPLYPADGQPLPQWNLVGNYAGKIFVGFQTREPQNLYGGKRKSAEVKEHQNDILRQALLKNGLSYHPDFIEVYEHDLNDPSLRLTLEEVQRNLK